MYCSQCGAYLPQDASFCAMCGTPQQRQPRPARQEAVYEEPVQPVPVKTVYVPVETERIVYRDRPAAEPHPHGPNIDLYPYKNRGICLVLCFMFGLLGVHRFYVGKVGTGILWFFTCGFFGIGWFIDLLCIACGGFRDKNGRILKFGV